MAVRSAERASFLNDVLITAIEHAGYGFSTVVEGEFSDEDPTKTRYVIEDRYTERNDEDYGQTWVVTIETIAAGIGVIKNAVMRDIETRAGGTEQVLHNATTGERLYLGPAARAEILEASAENDGGEIDVVAALAILECGIFGYVMYA